MIIGIIENIIAAMAESPAPSFLRATKGLQNLAMDNQAMPVIVMDEPHYLSEKIMASGAIFPTYRLRMLFADRTELTDLQAQLDEVTDEQKNYRREFILRLRGSEGVNDVSNISGQPFYNSDFWNLPLSGWTLEADVTVRDASSICLPPDTEADPCLAIEALTAQQIADCLSGEKEESLAQLICPAGGLPVSIIDQDENEIAEVECGGEFQVTVLTILNGGLPNTVYTSTILAPPL